MALLNMVLGSSSKIYVSIKAEIKNQRFELK